MRKNGFTLVELLGVIMVIAIILTISVPNILRTLKSIDVKEYNAFLKSVYVASESYVETNRSLFPQLKNVGGRVDIPIKTLIDEDLVKKMGIDPETGSEMPTTYTITATVQSDKTILYEMYKYDTNVDSYISDGIMAHLDGIYNVGPGQITNTSIWTDLALTNDFNLLNFSYNSNSGWVNNGLVFDGLNDYINAVGAIDLGTSWTLQFYLKYLPQNKTYEFLVGTNITTGSYGKIMMAKDGYVSYSYPAGTYNNFTTLSSSISNTNSSLAFVSNGTDVKLYLNGTLIDTKTIANSTFLLGMIGNAWSDNSWLTKLTLYNFKAYSRALTVNEINSNYQLDARRYR